MPRKKKVETVKTEPIEEVVDQLSNAVNYGTGWNRVNNMLQTGFKPEEIRRGKRNE